MPELPFSRMARATCLRVFTWSFDQIPASNAVIRSRAQVDDLPVIGNSISVAVHAQGGHADAVAQCDVPDGDGVKLMGHRNLLFDGCFFIVWDVQING